MKHRQPLIFAIIAAITPGVVAAGGPALATDGEEAPWAVLAWGEGLLQPGLSPGGPERQAHGPAALAVGEDGVVYFTDDVHRQVLVIDHDGEIRGAVSAPVAATDLRVDAAGRVAILAAGLDRVLLLSGGGALGRGLSIPAETRGVRQLAVGAGGRFWVETVDGSAALLDGQPSTMGARALPMGGHAAVHAAGRRTGPHEGHVLLWSWDAPAEVQPPGPRLKIAVSTERPLGLLRPLTVDTEGNVYVRVETLSDTAPLHVWCEVRRYDRQGTLTGRVSWKARAVAPAYRDADVGADGTLVRMESRPEGLLLWRWTATEWPRPEAGR